MVFETEYQNLIGMFTTDENLVVQIWDAALEEMTGISAENARGRSVVETIPNLESRGLLTRFNRVLKEGTVEMLAPAFHRFLISCKPQFPSKYFVEMRQRVTIAPLKENKTVRGLIVTVEDVTGRMEHEMELANQLKNSNETVRLQAAKALSNEPENLGEENAAPIISALGDKNWRVRRELVESLSRRAAPNAIAALLQAVKEKHLDFSILNSALKVLQATSVKTTETLVEFLHGDDADLRMQAALTLGEQKEADAIPALLKSLKDENTNVRYHAIEALGKLKAQEAVEPLLEIAESKDLFLSFAALDALRQIADESITTRILPLLNDDFLREAVIGTLGAVGREEIVSPIVSLLNQDKSYAPTVANALDAIFERYKNEFGNGSVIADLARQSIAEKGKSNLLEMLDSAESESLKSVVRIAGWFDNERLREKLVDLLENEIVREEAARSLAQGGESVVDLLIEKLEENDSAVRQTAARTLGKLKDDRAFEPLIELLQTGDSASRQAAVDALKSLAHPETVSRLCGLLAVEDSHVRESAIRVIGYFGASGCESAIFDCCEDSDERVRRSAIEQLPFIKDERAVSILVDALRNDKVSRVRESAAKALALVKSDESVAALRESLNDVDAWTRYFAVRALGTLQDSASREVLSEMAEKDAAEQVRMAAGEVLSELKI